MGKYRFYGTVGGCKSLVHSLDLQDYNYDARDVFDENSNGLFNKQLYGIRYENGMCVYQKYIFGRDTLKSKRTGFICVELLLEDDLKKKTEASSIKRTLDALLDKYSSEYVVDKNFNKGDSTSFIKEDKSLFDKILDSIDSPKDRSVEEQPLKSSDSQLAVLYYDSDKDLVEYFSKPYQEVYAKYKTVFVVDSQYKSDNIFKCEVVDLGKPDLSNILLKVKCPSGCVCEPPILRRNDEISITWTKKHYVDKQANGSLDSLQNSGFIDIDLENQVVNVKELELSLVKKQVKVKVKDSNKKEIKATLTCEDKYNKSKKIDVDKNGNVTLEGEDADNIKNFVVFVQTEDSQCIIKKDGYPLEEPETIITLEREGKVCVKCSTPNVTLKNDQLDGVNVKINVEVGDEKFESEGCYSAEKLCKEEIVLSKRSGSTFSINKGDKKEKDKDEDSEKKKNVDPKLLVAILAGLLLSVGTFFLGDYLDLNIFGSHNHQSEFPQGGTDKPGVVNPQDTVVIDTAEVEKVDSVLVENKKEPVDDSQKAVDDSKTITKDQNETVRNQKGNGRMPKVNEPSKNNDVSSSKNILKYKENELNKIGDETVSNKLKEFWKIEDKDGLDSYLNGLNDSRLTFLKNALNGKSFNNYPSSIQGSKNMTIEALLKEMQK